jgi:hypothetical protein
MNGNPVVNEKQKLKSSQLITDPPSIKSIKSSNDIIEKSEKVIKSQKNVNS